MNEISFLSMNHIANDWNILFEWLDNVKRIQLVKYLK